MKYARTFENEIVSKIPDGYTVSGVDKLTKSVENETGGFVSVATFKDNTLTVKIKKHYTHNYEPAANWSKMISFLDAAYQFTQEKVLIKKL